MNEDENIDAKGEENSSESSPEEETGEESSQSDEGDQNSDANKEIPFHEHPRWKEREAAWEKRFSDQEVAFNKRLEEIGTVATHKEMKSDEIPEWFGGDAKQWKAFQDHFQNNLKAVEDRAYERIKNEKETQDKAIADANNWFEESHKTLESENGLTIDRNQLLETALKYELIDTKGRWNYRAALEIMKSSGLVSKDANLKDRKDFAKATVRGSNKGENTDKSIVTSDDFATGKKERPW